MAIPVIKVSPGRYLTNMISKNEVTQVATHPKVSITRFFKVL